MTPTGRERFRLDGGASSAYLKLVPQNRAQQLARVMGKKAGMGKEGKGGKGKGKGKKTMSCCACDCCAMPS